MKRVLLFLAISLCISLTLNAQTISPVVPVEVVVGTDLTVTGTYILSEAGIVAVTLATYDGDIWIDGGDIASESIGVALATTDTDFSISITIPEGTASSASFIGTQKNYKVIVKLYDSEWGENREPAWSAFTGEIIGIELIGGTAGIEDLNVDGLVMYPNPVSDILRIKNVGVSEIKSFQIVDILGQVVIKQNNNTKVNSIDVSELSKGLYFLITNNNRQFKFVKE